MKKLMYFIVFCSSAYGLYWAATHPEAWEQKPGLYYPAVLVRKISTPKSDEVVKAGGAENTRQEDHKNVDAEITTTAGGVEDARPGATPTRAAAETSRGGGSLKIEKVGGVTKYTIEGEPAPAVKKRGAASSDVPDDYAGLHPRNIQNDDSDLETPSAKGKCPLREDVEPPFVPDPKPFCNFREFELEDLPPE